MAKLTLTVTALFALCFVGIATQPADAQGFHFGGGGVHVDVGRPHGGHGYYRQTQYQGGWNGRRGHSDWHDTTHYDYHPGTYVPHYGHYDYAPGHYDVHSSGHWDGHF